MILETVSAVCVIGVACCGTYVTGYFVGQFIVDLLFGKGE